MTDRLSLEASLAYLRAKMRVLPLNSRERGRTAQLIVELEDRLETLDRANVAAK
jgi:hypothetical protein